MLGCGHSPEHAGTIIPVRLLIAESPSLPSPLCLLPCQYCHSDCVYFVPLFFVAHADLHFDHLNNDVKFHTHPVLDFSSSLSSLSSVCTVPRPDFYCQDSFLYNKAHIWTVSTFYLLSINKGIDEWGQKSFNLYIISTRGRPATASSADGIQPGQPIWPWRINESVLTKPFHHPPSVASRIASAGAALPLKKTAVTKSEA